jgi:hypothetical protein
MKKLMMTLAAALSATAVVAQVTSGNVVGYTTVTIPSNQWTMIGMQFDQVGSTDGISVQDIFPNPQNSFKGTASPSSTELADNLMFWDPNFNSGSYVTLYLFTHTATATSNLNSTRKNKWRNGALVPNTAVWGAAGDPSSYKVKPGEGFWVKRVAGSYVNSNITATVAGQVVTGGKSRVMKEGWNLIAGSFTSPFTPNPDVAGTGPAIDWTAMGVAGTASPSSTELADNLMFWDPAFNGGSYVTLYYFTHTATATSNLNSTRKNKWRNGALIPNTAVWGASGDPSKYQAPLGNQGFWYKRLTGKGTFNLTEVQPYNLD